MVPGPVFSVRVLGLYVHFVRVLRARVPTVDMPGAQVLGVQVFPVILGMERHMQGHGERGEARGRPEGQRENRRQAAYEGKHGVDYRREGQPGQTVSHGSSTGAPHFGLDFG